MNDDPMEQYKPIIKEAIRCWWFSDQTQNIQKEAEEHISNFISKEERFKDCPDKKGLIQCEVVNFLKSKQ